MDSSFILIESCDHYMVGIISHMAQFGVKLQSKYLLSWWRLTIFNLLNNSSPESLILFLFKA